MQDVYVGYISQRVTALTLFTSHIPFGSHPNYIDDHHETSHALARIEIRDDFLC